MDEMERLSLGWTVSICSVDDPHIVNSNSAGGSNEIRCKDMAFGLLCRKEMTQ